MTYLEFANMKPDVVYDYVGFPPQTWRWYWTGIFGQGYYLLTKAKRRHPQGKFKVCKQVHRELTAKQCLAQPKETK